MEPRHPKRIGPDVQRAVVAAMNEHISLRSLDIADIIVRTSHGRLRPEVRDVERVLDTMLANGRVQRRMAGNGPRWRLCRDG